MTGFRSAALIGLDFWHLEGIGLDAGFHAPSPAIAAKSFGVDLLGLSDAETRTNARPARRLRLSLPLAPSCQVGVRGQLLHLAVAGLLPFRPAALLQALE